MANMTAYAGEATAAKTYPRAMASRFSESALALFGWLERNDYRAYDPFDGLNATYLRPLTFERHLLRTVLQQGVRRFPVNLRPVFGIAGSRSTKGMGFLARGFIRLHQATGEQIWAERARSTLQWLTENASPGYSGACWGNHFDYQARNGFYLPKGVPTIVWTSLIGHAFVDAYEHFHDEKYLQVAASACEHILRDLDRLVDRDSLCFSYIPTMQSFGCHNANCLGASLLSRAYHHTSEETFRLEAGKAIQYTAAHQRPDGSWYYGERPNQRWVDNFHTAYVLDSFKHYEETTGDSRFEAVLNKGYQYWKENFFLHNGTPKYYNYKTLPIDIQCSSQAIDTLVYFHDRDPLNVHLAQKVGEWTVDNMQDSAGYFYFRRYASWLVNRTPTLHWGQATMFCALAGLLRLMTMPSCVE